MEPFLSSPRLTFRTWTEADLPLAQSLWGDPEVALYLGGPFTPDDVRAKLQVEIDRQLTYGHQYWPIFLRESRDVGESGDGGETGTFAGAAGLRPFHDQPHVRELGVHIARPFWSARLGEEAARAVIRHAFDTLPLEALTAGHHPANTYSQALLQRLGFAYTHHEPWGPLHLQHPFYRLERPSASAPRATLP